MVDWRMMVSSWALAPVVLSLGYVAHADPMFVDASWRFTAVTERLIRVEYDANNKFVDEQTIAFLRSPPLGSFENTYRSGEWTILNTSKVSVRYQRTQQPSPATLTVISRSNGAHVWTWGDDPEPGNLRGTARTLDNGAETLDLNCHNKVSPTMDNSQMHCTWGLVSRKGWAVVNDTGAPMFTNDWYAPSRNSIDVSIFMHGLDFAGALKDFFHAAGPPNVPPRHALGTIFTRWYDFDQDSAMGLVEDFESRSMPLDVFIFDMNWHIYGPWGSFTWNDHSYPHLQEMLDWFQSKGLPIGANTHGHDGIAASEATYTKVCEALGRAPGASIPFDLYNKSYADAQENIAVRALDTKDGVQGIDFSWIDYQQGENDKFENTQIPNINPTIVLNRLRSSAPHTDGGKRSLVLSRWGGLGNHRYPVGFSGDQTHSWKGLNFLPYFTSTSANVAFNYWSHDTVGGDNGGGTDHELSVRWFQVSAWSPVLRMHDKGAGTGTCVTDDQCAKVLPWDVPTQFFEAIREASQVRDSLIPYIYTAAFSTLSTGLALCRPMYYEDPTDDALYSLSNQYLFGPEMIMSPITQPSGPDTRNGFFQALGAVQWTVFAPKQAKWVDRLNGDFFSNTNVSNVYGIKDVPGLVRQGAVIPMRPHIEGSWMARAVKPLEEVEFRIFPADAFYSGEAFSASGMAIDDDGKSTKYQQGEVATTECEYSFANNVFDVRVSQKGKFEGKPTNVTLRISFTQLPPMVIEELTGQIGKSDISYNRALLGSVFTVKNVDLGAAPFSIKIAIDPKYASGHLMQNFVGVLGRIRRARYAKNALDAINANYGDNRANITSYVLTGVQMSPKFVEGLPSLWASAMLQAKDSVAKYLQKDSLRAAYVSAMMGVQTTVTGKDGQIVI